MRKFLFDRRFRSPHLGVPPLVCGIRQLGISDNWFFEERVPSERITLGMDALLKKYKDDGEKSLFIPKNNGTYRPNIGDLICQDRAKAATKLHKFEDRTLGVHRAMHCDIVSNVNETEVAAIGGNVGDGVTKTIYSIDRNNVLKARGMFSSSSRTVSAGVPSIPIDSLPAPTYRGKGDLDLSISGYGYHRGCGRRSNGLVGRSSSTLSQRNYIGIGSKARLPAGSEECPLYPRFRTKRSRINDFGSVP